jgi:hypothetical protein
MSLELKYDPLPNPPPCRGRETTPRVFPPPKRGRIKEGVNLAVRETTLEEGFLGD